MRPQSGRCIAPDQVIFPGERAGDNAVEIVVTRFPAKNRSSPIGTGDNRRGIAGPPSSQPYVELAPRSPLDRAVQPRAPR